MTGLAGPLAGLSLLLCCSIVVGFAFDVSWKAGVPLLFLMSGVGIGAGVCVAKSEMISKHPRTVLFLASPLALLSIVPTVLSLILELQWAFSLPSIVLLISAAAIAILALCHSRIQVNRNDPRVSLSLLVAFSILSGVVLELSWIGGALMMIGLVGIVVWSCISVLWHMKRDSSITTFAIMTTIVLSCGVASINASIYAPFGFITLNVVMVAATPVVCLLLACQSDKILRNCRILVAIDAPLNLICIVSTALCYSITWHTAIPNGMFLAYSSMLLHYGLYETAIIKNNAILRFACLIMFPMLGFSSGLAYFLDPSLFPLAVVSTIVAAPFIFHVDFKETMTFAVSSFFFALYGTGMIVSSFYYTDALPALVLAAITALFVHSIIVAYQWAKIGKCPRAIVVMSALLTLLGVLACGLFFTIDPILVFPCGLFLVYAMIGLFVGLFESKAIKSNLTAVIILIIFLTSTASIFTSYFLAPLWTPVVSLACICAVPLLIFADFNCNEKCWFNGCYTAVLLLVIAASHGITLTTEMPIGWLLLLCMAQFIFVAIWGFHWIAQQFECSKLTVVVKRPLLLLCCLVFDIILMILLIFFYRHIVNISSVLIPIIFVAITALCIIAAQILFCLREVYRNYIAGAGFFLLPMIAYCYVLTLVLAGRSGARLPGWEEHMIGLMVSICLCYHCFIISCAGSMAAEDQQKAAMAAPPPPAAAAPPVAVVVQRDVDSDYDSGDDA